MTSYTWKGDIDLFVTEIKFSKLKNQACEELNSDYRSWGLRFTDF